MKKFLTTLLLLLPFVLNAQTTDPYELLIEFKTSLYEDNGAENALSLAFGSTQAGVHIDIDCGYGKMDFEVTVASLDEDSNITGSTFEGPVSSQGIVRIYGDPAVIDYFNGSANSISEITFHPDLGLQLLNLEHNNIEKINLNEMEELQVLYIMDNPFNEEPFNITAQLNNLAILEIGELGSIDDSFDITRFPKLMSFDAYYTRGLTHIDPSQCPYLYRLSMEMTDVESVNVSNNQNLMVLNVSDTRVSQLDLSNNAELVELYCTHGSGTINPDVDFTALDLSHNPKLEYLFCGGNKLTSLDLSNNPNLVILSAPSNELTSIDLSNNPNLYTVNLDGNRMNFATLPTPEEYWGEYYYNEADLVLNDTYKVGDVIDFSSQVLREETSTTAQLIYMPKDDPTNFQTLSGDYYDYENGIVTLKKAFDGQMRMVFYNSLLSAYELYSEPFTVRTVEEFGKDVKAMTISSITAEGAWVYLAVGVVGASAENPVTLTIDYGNDEALQQVTVTEEVPATYNCKAKRTGYGNIEIYVPQDHYISALKTRNLAISSIDLSNLSELRVLSIESADLYNIDLSYNAKLEELTITGNPNLTTLNLGGKTPYFYKGRMAHVNLSNNALKELENDDLYMVHYLDLSKNNFKEFDVTDADYLIEVDLSDNQIDYLQFNNSEELERCNVANNNLYYIYIPEDAPLGYLDVRGNTFAFGYMPENLWDLDDDNFLYAPQQNLVTPATSPGIDLSAYYIIDEDNNATQYVWKNEAGETLTAGTDYTISYGNTKFGTTLKGQNVYCELSHVAYPQFAGDKVLRTGLIKVIDTPTIVLATFTTTADYEIANVSLKGNKDNVSLYIDWMGNGDLTQYMLNTNEVVYAEAYTKRGATVRVLAAEEGDNFSVFSIADASMSSFDGSGLTEAVLIGVENAGLSSITLPASNTLMELKLSGNRFTSLDLSQYPNLFYLGANNNQLTSFDFSKTPNLTWAYLSYNKLSSVTFSGNNALYNLDLGCNQFSEISFEGAPNIGQLWLNGNKFTAIDLSYLKNLKVLDVVDNNLTFATLAHFLDDDLNVFRYGNQKDLSVMADGSTVDLSSQAEVKGTPTIYRWFKGKPEFDDNDELVGEELAEGSEYTVANGVTTFSVSKRIDNLVGVMTNEELPNLYLYTEPFVLFPTSIENLEDDALHNGKEYRNGNIIIRRSGKQFNLYGLETK